MLEWIATNPLDCPIWRISLFEIFITQISSQLQVFWINLSHDIAYADANRFIIQRIPRLWKFHFRYYAFLIIIRKQLDLLDSSVDLLLHFESNKRHFLDWHLTIVTLFTQFIHMIEKHRMNYMTMKRTQFSSWFFPS
jgi:hypothetical protein